MIARGRWMVIGLALALATGGCAAATGPPRPGVPSPMPGTRAAPPTPTTTSTPASAPSPIPGTPVGTTASGGSISSRAPVPAVVDSQPSAEALAVLKTIPEPVRGGEQPQASAGEPSAPPQASPPASPGDSAATDTASASGGEPEAPVPSPTEPLGDRPGSLARAGLPDSLLTPRAARDSSGGHAGGGATPDSCWRVQVGAPPDTTRAHALRAAAESQLLVPMVIERERGLYKVRTRDCQTAAGSESFRRRALAAGFSGAFRFVERRR